MTGVVADVVRYCGEYAGPLVRVSWLPCLLTAVGLIALEWFIIAHSEQMPDWILSDDFYPPSWIAALIPAPLQAMVWMSVIGAMERGEPPKPGGGPLGLALNQRIIVGTIIFSILNLLIGGSRNLERMFLINGLPLIHGPEPAQVVLETWVGVLLLVHGIAAVVLSTVFYLMAGPVFRQGHVDFGALRALTRGNRWRLLALFAILGGIRSALVLLIDPAVGWMTDHWTDTTSWTLAEAALRHGTYIPINMLTFVASAVVVELALRRLEKAPPSAASA